MNADLVEIRLGLEQTPFEPVASMHRRVVVDFFLLHGCETTQPQDEQEKACAQKHGGKCGREQDYFFRLVVFCFVVVV